VGVSYELVVAAYLAVAFGLLFAWLATGAVVRRRIQFVSIAVVASPFVLFALGAPLRPDEQPLADGDLGGGDDPALLQVTNVGDGRFQYTYAFQPGGEIRTGISLANNGNVPLTVTGVGPPEHPIYVREYKFLLPPGGPATGPVTVFPGVDPTWTSDAFKPFEIPAHSEVVVGLAVDLTSCPDLKPVPTLAPGESLIPDGDLTYSMGFGAADLLPVDYAAFGISRTAIVELQGYMNVAVGNSSNADMPSCQSQ
jgi:hypothetical protein